MTIVTTMEAQSNLPQLIASLTLEEEVLITADGLPVARLVKPNIAVAPVSRPAIQTNGPEANTDEEDDRPWRGVFAVESRAELYPCGKLRLPVGRGQPLEQPVDILWDRASHSAY